MIEPDLSNAAPFLALAAVTGGTVTVRDWPTATTQAGDALREILTPMGCAVDFVATTGCGSPAPARSRGVDLDLHDVGELTPAVAALCALADSPSHLRGIAHIRGHETDRLAALATELGGLGADVTEHADGLSIRPAPLHGGVFHTYADHRMAHAGVIVGAAVDGVEVENVATTSKTFPDFAGLLGGLHGELCEQADRALHRPGPRALRAARAGAPARAPRSARPTTTRSTASSSPSTGAGSRCWSTGSTVMAMKARPLGRKGVVVGDRVRVVGDISGADGSLARIVEVVRAGDHAAAYGRRRRPGRAGHRRQRRPAGGRHRARRPRAAAAADRPRPGGGVRRRACSRCCA